MAVSQIEEKILGRLARQIAPLNIALSSSLYQVLGLSIQLSKRLYRARKLRKLDFTRDTKSLQLYHHIIWLAKQGLDITEGKVLFYLRSDEHGPEYRVMAAKIEASLRHILCLFDIQPSQSPVNGSPKDSVNTPSRNPTPKDNARQSGNSPKKASPNNNSANTSRPQTGKAALRDPIPSMTSETSYVTNPYAIGSAQTPPSSGLVPPTSEARRTPVRPPGLPAIDVANNQANALFLLSTEDKVPATRGYFNQAQRLADSLLSPASALRLSVTLDHAAFLWDCAKEPDRARKLAKRAIKEVYASNEGIDDDEFADASALVQALGGFVKRGSTGLTPKSSLEQPVKTPSPADRRKPPLAIDRTIALSPTSERNKTTSPSQIRTTFRTPEQLSTVQEVESIEDAQTQPAQSPPVSRPGSRIPQRQVTSPAATKTGNKKAPGQAKEPQRQAKEPPRQNSVRSNGSSSHSRPHSRQATPPEGYVRSPKRSPRRNGGNG